MNNKLTDFQDDDLSDDILERIRESREESDDTSYFLDNDEEQLFFRTFECITEQFQSE
jgi:hypothetical protein